jgi:hypothetical protein
MLTPYINPALKPGWKPLTLATIATRARTVDPPNQDPRTELLLGGRPPVAAATARAVTGTEASSEAALTIAQYRPNQAAVARSLLTVSFTVNLQNELPSTSRSCRIKPHRFLCPRQRA